MDKRIQTEFESSSFLFLTRLFYNFLGINKILASGDKMKKKIEGYNNWLLVVAADYKCFSF